MAEFYLIKGFFYLFNFVLCGVKYLDKNDQELSNYPEVITRLPEAEIQFEGAKGWILQADMSQLIFFLFETNTNLPTHRHSYVQWGIVLDGAMELNIDGKLRVCRKGDEYVIPAGAFHSAKFLLRTRVIDYFSEKSRHNSKLIK
jgi:mannose-6-phosphate isomerase-like protein (cupin superfamily)